MAAVRRLTKTDYAQTAILTVKVVAVLAVLFGAIIFTPLLRWMGYQDASRTRAVAEALIVVLVIALVTPPIELVKRWLDGGT
jgi:Kef-type K+ transport system membrane component KefB